MAYDTSKLASLQALKDTATRIKKEYLAAISKAGHASFQKAEAIPAAEEAQENTTTASAPARSHRLSNG